MAQAPNPVLELRHVARSYTEARGRLDVVVEAGSDMDVLLAIGFVLIEKALPVAGRGLVGARLRRRDATVNRDADPLQGGVEQLGIRIREDGDPEAAAS